MDEMYTQKEFGVAISILYIITFVGFPISVLFAGASLNMYVTLDPPEGMTPGRPEWVGAWWLGFLVPGVVVFVVSFIVMLFPTQMPAAKVRNFILMNGSGEGFCLHLRDSQKYSKKLLFIVEFEHLFSSYKSLK